MIDRRTTRGVRRPVIVDLLISVAVASLLMTGLRATLGDDLDASHRRVATLAMLGVPAVAVLYGAAAAVEMRRGWVGTSLLAGLLHTLLALGSLVGIALLWVLAPMAAGMAIAAEGVLLLWSSSWL